MLSTALKLCTETSSVTFSLKVRLLLLLTSQGWNGSAGHERQFNLENFPQHKWCDVHSYMEHKIVINTSQRLWHSQTLILLFKASKMPFLWKRKQIGLKLTFGWLQVLLKLQKELFWPNSISQLTQPRAAETMVSRVHCWDWSDSDITLPKSAISYKWGQLVGTQMLYLPAWILGECKDQPTKYPVP